MVANEKSRMVPTSDRDLYICGHRADCSETFGNKFMKLKS